MLFYFYESYQRLHKQLLYIDIKYIRMKIQKHT